MAERFRLDPRRTGDATSDLLTQMAQPGETWLDIGAGGGRYALPLALHVREVVAVEPSEAMLAILRDGMARHGIDNIHVVPSRWPVEGAADIATDVALIAHLGYDVEEIGPFLTAMERAVGSRCLAVLAETAMTTVASRLWEPLHGEPRVPLPALPEFLTLQLARDRLCEVTLLPREPISFESFEEALALARRQLWLRPGSDRDRRLTTMLHDLLEPRGGRLSLDWTPLTIGVVTWRPR